MITNTYKLSLTPGGVPLVIPVSQYDAKSRTLSFVLYSDTGTVDITGASALVEGTKPDGNGFSYSASISGTTATVTVTQQMCAVAGRVPCEIILYTGTRPTTANPNPSNYVQLGTANFILQVERAALDKDTIPSDSEIGQLIDVIDRTDEIIDAADRAEAAAESIVTSSVRYDEAQSLTTAQQAQARTNISAAKLSVSGNTLIVEA